MATSTASISFHAETKTRAQVYAAKAGVTLSALVDHALREQLDRPIPVTLQQVLGPKGTKRKQCKTCFQFGHNSRRCGRLTEKAPKKKPAVRTKPKSRAAKTQADAALALKAAQYLADHGGTVGAVSVAFGVTRWAVTSAWKKAYGEAPVPTMRQRDGRIDRAVARVDAGETVRDAAVAESCAASNVYSAIQKRREAADPTVEPIQVEVEPSMEMEPTG